MIIGDLDPFGAGIRLDEANPPLLVDADRMLATAVAGQSLQPIAGR
jgi:hypothetical protein